MLPPVPPGVLTVEHCSADLLIVRLGVRPSSWLVLFALLLTTLALSLIGFGCVGASLLQQRDAPGDLSMVVSYGVLVLGVHVCVVLFWHRHFRQTVRLTASRQRQELEIVRSVGGLPVRSWVRLDQGGAIVPEVPPPITFRDRDERASPHDPSFDDVLAIDGPTQQATRLGMRLDHREQRWLLVILNRVFGLPRYCLPDGRPYPEECPDCGRPLRPSRVDTRSGAIGCVGLPTCAWSSNPQAQPFVELLARARQVMGESRG
jgi:hypothetical protein